MTEESLFMRLNKANRVLEGSLNNLTILTNFHPLTSRFTHCQHHEERKQYTG